MKVKSKKAKSKNNLEKYKDIVERTFEFAVKVIKLMNGLEKNSLSTRTLSSQALRSATSIGANVEEAQAADE